MGTMPQEIKTEVINGEEVAGSGVQFERIRRITGYLVGTLDRFNNGKRAEEHDRVKHTGIACGCRKE